MCQDGDGYWRKTEVQLLEKQQDLAVNLIVDAQQLRVLAHPIRMQELGNIVWGPMMYTLIIGQVDNNGSQSLGMKEL